jgi:hypothetical protein
MLPPSTSALTIALFSPLVLVLGFVLVASLAPRASVMPPLVPEDPEDPKGALKTF